jgi:threonine/homoserine/homoserine lactone efflux protein
MFGIENLWLFVVSGILLNIIPGPDSLYIVAKSTRQGFRAGSVATLGIASGILVHVLAAAFGLSAILATSATAFTVVKIMGCAYLFYIGLSMVLNSGTIKTAPVLDKKVNSLKKVFYQGFLTNIFNPKIALFFLAFVPQFISIDSPNTVISFILLGLVFIFNSMIWCILLAWTSSSIGGKIKQNEFVTTWLVRAAGILFCYFGIKLAFSEYS